MSFALLWTAMVLVISRVFSGYLTVVVVIATKVK
jgi:hypothetical protein